MGGDQVDWRNIPLCCGTGLDPIPNLDYTGEGYGIKGIRFTGPNTTNASGFKLNIRGAKRWNPSEGPMDEIAEGLPKVTLNDD